MWERQIYPHIENTKGARKTLSSARGRQDRQWRRRLESDEEGDIIISLGQADYQAHCAAPAPDHSVLVTGLCNQTDQPSSQLHPLTFTQLLARRARRGLSDTYCTDTVINCRHLVYRLVASLVSSLMSCSRRPYYPRHLRAQSNCAKMCFCNKFQIFCEQIYLESYFRTCG